MKKFLLTTAAALAMASTVTAQDTATERAAAIKAANAEARLKAVETDLADLKSWRAALEAKPPVAQPAAATLPPATPTLPVAMTNAAGAVTTPAPVGMRWTKAGTIDSAAPWTLEPAPVAVAPQFAAPTFPTPIRSFFAPSYGSCANGNCPQ